jgi:hypothetical protein
MSLTPFLLAVSFQLSAVGISIFIIGGAPWRTEFVTQPFQVVAASWKACVTERPIH